MQPFTHYTKDDAPEPSQQLLADIESSYGFIPDLFHYMAAAPIAIKAYQQLDALLSESSLTERQKQLALLTASSENNCNFCKVAHHVMAKQAGVDAATITAIKDGEAPAASIDKVLVALVRSLVRHRGRLSEQVQEDFIAEGYRQQQILELVVAVTLKTLSNYCNHLTHPTPNPELQAML